MRETRSARGAAILLGLVVSMPSLLLAQSVDLQAAKSVTGTPSVGGSFNYTVTITNIGTFTATGVTVTDVLPPGLNFVSGPGCTNNGETLTCVVGTGTLGPGGSAAVTITVSPTQTGTIKNVVGVIANEPDGNMANNSATAVTNVGAGNPPPVPTGLAATATLSTQVSLTWNASAGATSYIVERSALLANYSQIGTSVTSSFVDNTAAANTAYVYQVKAVSSGGTSAPGNRDLATTVIFTDDPLNPVGQPRTLVKAVHFTQLKQAVNAVQVAASQAPLYWSAEPAPAAGVVIEKARVYDLRSWIIPARTALGFSDPAFFEPDLTGKNIQRVHIDQLRDRVK